MSGAVDCNLEMDRDVCYPPILRDMPMEKDIVLAGMLKVIENLVERSFEQEMEKGRSEMTRTLTS